MNKQKILVVEDDVDIANLLRDAMLREGYEVITVTTGELAMEIIEEFSPDLVTMDVLLPEGLA